MPFGPYTLATGHKTRLVIMSNSGTASFPYSHQPVYATGQLRFCDNYSCAPSAAPTSGSGRSAGQTGKKAPA